MRKEYDSYGGTFYIAELEEKTSKTEYDAGKIDNFDRFCASYRQDPFFMHVKISDELNDLPKETQWFGVRHTDGTYSVFFSMSEGLFRTSFYGKDGRLFISAITGDSGVSDDKFYAYYSISGADFYALAKTAAKSISEKFKTVTLREEKRVPEFSKYFGWCTWDSFYEKVREEDVVKGLESFKAGGFVPKFLILDDGWQDCNSDFSGRGEWKLKGFGANEKFGYTLKNAVKTAKEKYGVQKFFVWHAVMGYWGGVDPTSDAMKKYMPRLSCAEHTDGLKENNPERCKSEHFPFGIIDKDKAFDFYNDYHSHLKREGIDGVKIDVQAAVDAHAEGVGGCVELVKRVRDGLEASVCYNFDGEMINCMSCSNDIIYHVKNTNMMRSSDDFFPTVPESHQRHIVFNAVNSIWMSGFTMCDWDMFQTKHEYALYHAAARAISGGPVYVSDRVDEHDFDLIRALVDDNGEILRAEGVAAPTEDCLFADIEKAPYKIFNKNRYNGVVGVFASGDTKKTAHVSPCDVHGFKKGKYLAYSMREKRAYLIEDESIDVSVKANECDVLTFAEVRDGFAAVGICGKINGGAAVKNILKTDCGIEITVSTSGELVLYSETEAEIYDGKKLLKKGAGIMKVPVDKKNTRIVLKK